MADKSASLSENSTANVYVTIKVTVPTIEHSSAATITVSSPAKRIVRRIPS